MAHYSCKEISPSI